MQILCKGKYFKTNHVWFENIDKCEKGYDKIIINGAFEPIDSIGKIKCSHHKQETLLSDLSISEEELWGQVTKTVHNEINRSKREGVEVRYYNSELITDELLNDFDKMYVGMYESKGIKTSCVSRNMLKAYKDSKALLVTVAYIDGLPVVYHTYIYDRTHTRLLHSCSEFRTEDNSVRNAIGRSNKYLHWNDWLYFKEKGIFKYDWGGISSYINPNGIDKFKMSFGGTYQEYYNIFASCSLKAKMQQALTKIRN